MKLLAKVALVVLHGGYCGLGLCAGGVPVIEKRQTIAKSSALTAYTVHATASALVAPLRCQTLCRDYIIAAWQK